MPFINEILKHRSLSIVGLEKNTGKTVTLNYILRRLNQIQKHDGFCRETNAYNGCAVTSIGVDGEQTDSVYGSAKPEITLYDGMQFITSERHYAGRQLVSEILAVDERSTSLGRLVTGRVVCGGKILLSGAATTGVLRQQIADFTAKGVGLTIIDGALSRLSLASPTVTEAMVLATGAAVSTTLKHLVARTRFVCNLIDLPEVDDNIRKEMAPKPAGLWGLDSDGKAHDLGINSVFMLGQQKTNLFEYGTTLFAAGAVSDRLLKHLAAQKTIESTRLIVRDFTKFFVTPEIFNDYTRKGGTIEVLQRSHLIAVTLNPTSPQGYNLNSEEACHTLSDALGIPVYDVMSYNNKV